MIESERTLDELKNLREISMKLIKTNSSEKDFLNTKISLLRWIPRILTKGEENKNINVLDTDDIKHNELEAEILEVVESTIKKNSLFEKDVVFAQINLLINYTLMSVLENNTSHSNPVIEIFADNILVDTLITPKIETLRISSTIDTFLVRTAVSTILQLPNQNFSATEDINSAIRLDFDNNLQTSHRKLLIALHEPDIYYDFTIMNQFINKMKQIFYFSSETDKLINSTKNYQLRLHEFNYFHKTQENQSLPGIKLDVFSPSLTVIFETNFPKKLLAFLVKLDKVSFCNYIPKSFVIHEPKHHSISYLDDSTEDVFVTPSSSPQHFLLTQEYLNNKKETASVAKNIQHSSYYLKLKCLQLDVCFSKKRNEFYHLSQNSTSNLLQNCNIEMIHKSNTEETILSLLISNACLNLTESKLKEILCNQTLIDSIQTFEKAPDSVSIQSKTKTVHSVTCSTIIMKIFYPSHHIECKIDKLVLEQSRTNEETDISISIQRVRLLRSTHSGESTHLVLFDCYHGKNDPDTEDHFDEKGKIVFKFS